MTGDMKWPSDTAMEQLERERQMTPREKFWHAVKVSFFFIDEVLILLVLIYIFYRIIR